MFFSHLLKQIKNNFSFGLVESAVTVAVMGTIAGATISAYHSTNPQVRKDVDKMAKIEEALQQFFTIHGRLPFPADPTVTIGNNDYLRERKANPYNYSKENYFCGNSNSLAYGSQTINTCVSSGGRSCCPNNFVIWGIVPVRSIGLPDSYAYDSQGHNFEYITHSALTFSNGDKFISDSTYTKYYKKSSYTQNNQNKNINGKYSVYFTTDDTRYQPITLPIKGLNIKRAHEASIITETENNTAYVIMSKGKTSRCYFDAKNSVIETTLPPDSTINNCVQNYRNGTTDIRTIYQGYSSNSFDILVKYKTLDELVSINAVNKSGSNGLSMSVSNLPQYQLKIDNNLKTDGKDLVKAINELKQRTDELEFGIDVCSNDAITNGLYVANNTLNKINDATKSKNLALWAPGKYKFKGDACINSYYNNVSDNWQLPISRAGELMIYAISTKPESDVRSSSSNHRLYEYIDYKGHTWTAYHQGTFTDNMRLNWSVTCDTTWPIGSIYISTNTSTASDVKNKLGCGTWEMLGANQTLWSVSSSGGAQLNACLPNISGYFGINTGAFFTSQPSSVSNSNVFKTQTNRTCEHTGYYEDGNGKIQMDFSKATGSLHKDTCTTIIPSAIKVFIWKRIS